MGKSNNYDKRFEIKTYFSFSIEIQELEIVDEKSPIADRNLLKGHATISISTSVFIQNLME